MSSSASIEQRLTAVEKSVAEIQRRLQNEPPVQDWIERFTGAFENDPVFSEIVAYGEMLRSGLPPARGSESPHAEGAAYRSGCA